MRSEPSQLSPRKLLLFCLPAAGGLLLGATFLLPWLFPLAWVSFIPLVWCLHRSALRWGMAALCGWLMGLGANLAGFYWLSYTIRVFGGFPHGVAEFVFLLYAALAALQFAFLSLVVWRWGVGPFGLIPPLVWVALEFWFPLLFPWHLANSQASFLTLIQSADLVGPYGTSFLIMWFNVTLHQFLFSDQKRLYLRQPIIIVALLCGTLAYGEIRRSTIQDAMRAAPKLSLAAVQGSIDIRHKWNVTYVEANLKSFLDLTAKIDRADLVIWPENAIEAWVPDDILQLPPEVLPSLPSESTSWIFGARSLIGEPFKPGFKAFNSAFLVDARGRVLGRYHKQKLLAFGEYVPFSRVLSWLPGLTLVGEGFTPGSGAETLGLPDGRKLALLICYEDLMPELVRRFVAGQGADLLVNLTNDAWFGDTLAPWQHARLSQWRAIEARRTLVRSTNTGLTAVISPLGEIRQSLPTFTPGVLGAEVELMQGRTFYVRYGDWFAWLATVLFLAIPVGRGYLGRQQGKPES